MKLLKSIGQVYLGMLLLAIIGLFLTFPILLAEYMKDDRIYYLFLINLPIFFGVIFSFEDNESTHPKR